jgi:uncharacterized protein YndB with AHSA1/START domain
MLKRSLIVIAALVVVLIGIIAMQPSEFRVARTTTIAAPAPVVFAQVNDFHKWEAWNPWGKIDPAMKASHEGPPAGVGAAYAWAGNSQVGEGRMTVTESQPNELVRIRLDFLKPMSGTSTAEFTLRPEGDQTAVVWSMTGHNNFLAKAFCLFVNMDKMIGDQFEKGLAQMKVAAEAAART